MTALRLVAAALVAVARSGCSSVEAMAPRTPARAGHRARAGGRVMRTRLVFLFTILVFGPGVGPAAALNLNPHGAPMPADVAAGDHYGASVAISGDTLVIGAPLQNGHMGAAYVFVRVNGVWLSQQKLLGSDSQAGDQFGFSVAIDGDTVVVGAPWDEAARGAVFVFVRSGVTWLQQTKLAALAPPVPQVGFDWFGFAVAVKGNTAVVGAPLAETAAANDAGRAFVFSRTGVVWSAGVPVQSPAPVTYDFFGWSVSGSGSTVAVGVPLDDVGTPAVVDQGSACVFTSIGGAWTQQACLTASDGAAGDWFGVSMSLSGDTLAVGASLDDVGAAVDQGSVYVFDRTSNVWAGWTKHVAAGSAPGDAFGASVALSGDLLVVGAPKAVGAYGLATGGVVFSFERVSGSWQSAVHVALGSGGAELGTSVSVSGATAAAGAPLADALPAVDQGFVDTYYPAPVVTSVSPDRGAPAGGTVVTITGKYFLSGAWVVIGGSGVEETFVNSTSMTATMPSGVGSLAVRVWNPDQQYGTLAGAFLYTCEWTTDATAQVIAVGGGTASIGLTVPDGCRWGLSSAQDWVRFGSGGFGTGAPQTATFTIDPNTSGGPRSAVVTIEVIGLPGKTFTVSQPLACTYALSSTGTSYFAGAASGTLTVATQLGCPWDVVTNNWTGSSGLGWLTLGMPHMGSGPGSLGYSLVPNNDAYPRSVEVFAVIGSNWGPKVTVTQSPFACDVTISPASQDVAPGGGPYTMQVTAAPGCGWRALGDPWLTVTAPADGRGVGNGQFSCTAAPNATGASRPLTLSIYVSNLLLRTIPLTQPPCTFSVSPTTALAVAQGGSGTITVNTQPGCTWDLVGHGNVRMDDPAFEHTGSQSLHWTTDGSVLSYSLEFPVNVAGTQVTIVQDGRPWLRIDTPADHRMSSETPTITGTAGDADGVASVSWTTNHGAAGTALGTTEWRAIDVPLLATAPTTFTVTITDIHGSTATEGVSLFTSPTYYLAEGSTGLFGMRIAVFNPDPTPCHATVDFLRESGPPISSGLYVPGHTRVSIDPASWEPLAAASFSTKVQAQECRLVVDRTMWWDAARRYGGHAETAVRASATAWFLAEGATHSTFDLFYLIQNPGTQDTTVRVRYLLPAPLEPVVKDYFVAGNSRKTIWVDYEDPRLATAEISGELTSTNGVPIIVERAMYFTSGGRFWSGGHEGAGVRALSPDWFLAEGATGPFFDMFVLLGNPNAKATTAEMTYLLPDGSTIISTYDMAASSRRTVWVNFEAPQLARADVSVRIHTLDGTGIVVERAMWWRSGIEWYEAHNSAGTTETGSRWALAEGEEGGPNSTSTWILIANTSSTPGQVRVTLFGEDGAQVQKTVVVPASSRTTVSVGASPEFSSFLANGGTAGRRFSALVESLGDAPAQIVVERAMYWDAEGVFWAAGTDAVASRLR
jgi:hypothetical protein